MMFILSIHLVLILPFSPVRTDEDRYFVRDTRIVSTCIFLSS